LSPLHHPLAVIRSGYLLYSIHHGRKLTCGPWCSPCAS